MSAASGANHNLNFGIRWFGTSPGVGEACDVSIGIGLYFGYVFSGPLTRWYRSQASRSPFNVALSTANIPPTRSIQDARIVSIASPDYCLYVGHTDVTDRTKVRPHPTRLRG